MTLGEVSHYKWKKTEKKCFCSNLGNENVLRIEDGKIKEKYLELPFGAGSLLTCCWVSSLPPPHCVAISKLLFCMIPIIRQYLTEMGVHDRLDNKWVVKSEKNPCIVV